MILFADELWECGGNAEDETTAETEYGVEGGNWRPFHNLRQEGIEILRYFPENTRHVLSIVCLYRRCQQKSRPGTHSSSRQLNPFFFSLLSLPGGLLSTGVSFCLQWVDSSSQWEHLPASKPPNVPKPPPTGTIIPLTSHPESRFLQPVGESARWQLTQSPETATHWNNHPAYKPLSVPILPVTGRIAPLERVYWRHE